MGQRGPKKGTRPSGRKKGTPNKRSTELLSALEAHGCIIAEQIAKLFHDTTVIGPLKLDLLAKILPYLYPERKPIDPEGYLTVEQAAGMLGAQASKFRDALAHHVSDPATIALILESLRASKP